MGAANPKPSIQTFRCVLPSLHIGRNDTHSAHHIPAHLGHNHPIVVGRRRRDRTDGEERRPRESRRAQLRLTRARLRPQRKPVPESPSALRSVLYVLD